MEGTRLKLIFKIAHDRKRIAIVKCLVTTLAATGVKFNANIVSFAERSNFSDEFVAGHWTIIGRLRPNCKLNRLLTAITL